MSITRINNNVSALNAGRNLNRSGANLSKNIERLSSGLRINRAGDDAAGLTVRERLRTQIRGTNQATLNAQNGISMVNTSEAALDSLVSSLQRIRELAIAAGNTGSNDAQSIQAIQDEVFQQVDEVNRIATTARFSTRVLFTGDNANTSFVKAGQDELGVKISDDPNASNLRSGSSILNIIRTRPGAENLIPFKKEDGQAIYATGIQNATDVAVTTAQFLRGGASATTTDTLSAMTFDGVSVSANNVIAFQGVLSDGATPFAGALSVTNANGVQSMRALMSTIQTAIDNAETSLFGGVQADIPGSFIQTHVSLGDPAGALAAGTGRLRFFSAQQAGSTTTTTADITDGPSQFGIRFSVIDNAGDLKHAVVSTRDFVNGENVGAQFGNHVDGITGSTFDTGNFAIEVTDVIPPSRRLVETELAFTNSAGAILGANVSLAGNGVLNGTFVGETFTLGASGIALEAGDRVTIQGINADGTTFESVFTLATAGSTDTNMGDFQFATLSGLIAELNFRDRTAGLRQADQQSSYFDSTVRYNGKGHLELIDDVAQFSASGLFFKVEDDNTNRTLTDRAQLVRDGNPEQATISIDGGPRQQVVVGENTTLFGPEPTLFGESTPQLSMRMGAGFRADMGDTIFQQGADTAEIEAQEYIGSLNGGPAITFQNGDQNVFFESGQAEGIAETLLMDFDAILDITGPPRTGEQNTGRAILISTVNNALNFQIGPFKGQDLQLNIPDLRADRLGFGRDSGRTVSDINVTTIEGVNEALAIVDQALDQVSRTRSLLGAVTNRMETTVTSLTINAENLTASESRISDVDLAEETSRFTSNQILFQAGTSVLAQANFLPQGLLSLLG